MKIGVTTENGIICGHFGHAKNFTVFTVENDQITDVYELGTQGNHCSTMPDFIKENGISVVITSGMGQGAIDGLSEMGIRAYSGVNGDPKKAVEKCIKGELENEGANCSGHGEHGSCHH
ncbi:NifB/NifX family molybdenum-iron cluster-binding protein [Peptostreptococcus canis]|uniref:Dinitrogenase iron-molybdenum cofactor biosynthesis protein n=1 Tax=Peptostreptococcus canis TaxID=1159213 RepID=A0ABR6TKM4_9FIRM|nr:NifB/NifX family molybdenum-iron cluster-binding protein [Peptostreptococcus canis]MBC2575962.1 dinitrogenase iron-molybdenum cofactor biosynthesis protein [Peptostreptococcus canis]MBP1997916.1 putative Fe-Mo cluster-binding NifX family protein [Peptostreptococcus canis]